MGTPQSPGQKLAGVLDAHCRRHAVTEPADRERLRMQLLLLFEFGIRDPKVLAGALVRLAK